MSSVKMCSSYTSQRIYLFRIISNKSNTLCDGRQSRLQTKDMPLKIVDKLADLIARPNDESCGI